jgi:DNA-directed RNA polymerase subunit delta
MAKKKVVKLDDMTKEELELLSYKDITNMILTEKGAMNTADLFNYIVKLLELPKSAFEKKIGDYYTTLTTDKRFVLLDDGKWDLRNNHTSDKVLKAKETEEEEEEEEEETDLVEEEEMIDNYDEKTDDDDFDDSDDDLKDLVVVDEEELELEE